MRGGERLAGGGLDESVPALRRAGREHPIDQELPGGAVVDEPAGSAAGVPGHDPQLDRALALLVPAGV